MSSGRGEESNSLAEGHVQVPGEEEHSVFWGGDNSEVEVARVALGLHGYVLVQVYPLVIQKHDGLLRFLGKKIAPK